MSDIVIDPTPPPPPPAVAPRKKRLTDELKAIPAGSSFLADFATAQSYVMFARRNSYEVTTQKQPDGRIRVWRTA